MTGSIWQSERPKSYQPLAELAGEARGLTRQDFCRAHPTCSLIVGGDATADSAAEEFVTGTTRIAVGLRLEVVLDHGAFIVPLAKRAETFPGIIWVGRDRPCDVWLPVPTISKLHGQFTAAPGGEFDLSDLGSTNGTFVNGLKLEPKKNHRLMEGDLICFGHLNVRFHGPAGLWGLARSA